MKHQGVVHLEAETKTKPAASITANYSDSREASGICWMLLKSMSYKVIKPSHLISDHPHDKGIFLREKDIIPSSILRGTLTYGFVFFLIGSAGYY